MLHIDDAQEESKTSREKEFGVSLKAGDALPDIEDVPSINTSLLELLQVPFGTPLEDVGAGFGTAESQSNGASCVRSNPLPFL
jgi:hypothetical protein